MRDWIPLAPATTRTEENHEHATRRFSDWHPAAVASGFEAIAGSATAEYAIATLAAVGFAGLLVVILRSDAVRGMLTNLIQHALSYSDSAAPSAAR